MLRLSGERPMWKALVPALSTSILDPSPAASTRCCMTPAAVGDRQMFPRQTKQRRSTNTVVAVPDAPVEQESWRSSPMGTFGRCWAIPPTFPRARPGLIWSAMGPSEEDLRGLRQVGDPPADRLVAELYAAGQTAAVNRL